MEEIGHLLLPWYDRFHRELPWRGVQDPYAIWVSETMLQQTRVETVRSYFPRFMARFPSLAALAQAPLEDVLKCWEGLGYYRRAQNLHRGAQQVMDAYGGRLPIQQRCGASPVSDPIQRGPLPALLSAFPAPRWTAMLSAWSAGWLVSGRTWRSPPWPGRLPQPPLPGYPPNAQGTSIRR